MRHDGSHDDCGPCRWKTVTVARSATPSRQLTKNTGQRHGERVRDSNAWERGVAGERRVDGSFMPYVDSKLEPIGLKAMQDNPSLRAERAKQLQSQPPE